MMFGKRYRKSMYHQKLGEGSYGCVFVVNNFKGEELALKNNKRGEVIYTNVLTRMSCLKAAMRNYREIKILKTLQHPNIIQLVDVFSPNIDQKRTQLETFLRSTEESDSERDRNIFPMFCDLYMVFELMHFDLYRLSRSDSFVTLSQANSIAQQIVCGLNFMHASHVIHRDIKPENILISIRNPIDSASQRLNSQSEFIVKIADFGLARVISEDDVLISSGIGDVRSTSPDDEHDEPKESIACSDLYRPNTPPVLGLSSCGPKRASLFADSPTGDGDSNGDTTVDSSIAIGPPLPSFTTASSPTLMKRQYSNHVVSRWYRAPEVVLGEMYQSAVDMWSFGCVLVDVLNLLEDLVPKQESRRALFQGSDAWGNLSKECTTSQPFFNSRHGILISILELVGIPDQEDLETMSLQAQHAIRQLGPIQSQSLYSRFPTYRPNKGGNQQIDELLELAAQCLKFLPGKRVTANTALRSLCGSEQIIQDATLYPPTKLSLDIEARFEDASFLCTSTLEVVLEFHDKFYAQP